MSEEKELEKTPVVRPEAAPEVKVEAQPPMEKPEAMPPAEKAEAIPPVEKEETKPPVEVPAEAPAPEEAPVEEAAPAPEEAAAEEAPTDVHVDAPEADMEINIVDDRDKEAESLIRWAAGRAGVIVAAPLLGTVALVANEVYMIHKIGTVYGVELNQKAVLSFIGSLGATVVGSTLATLIPLSIMQIPIGISVTYGLGKAAQRWIKDGMPDDTKPYRAVFEEGQAEGQKEEAELAENPKKDEPLGDEKKDFTKELKKNWDDVYPEKAHAAVEKLADRLTEQAGILGDKFIEALKKAGVTDEQIDKAKYTALGASEIAQETAEKTAKDIQAIARVKSREFRKDAMKKADEMRAQAKGQMDEFQKKGDEMKHQSEVQSQQMKLKSEKMKAQARVQMQEAKIKASKLQAQAKEQADLAQAKAKEYSEAAQEAANKYKEAATNAANQAKESILSTAKEYKAKIEERAAQKQAEAEAAKKESAPVEAPAKTEEAPAPAEETKGE